VTIEACEAGTAESAITNRNSQTIFFFMKFSSDGLVLGFLDRSQSNRGDLFSERWRKFAQDTKHGGFTTMFR
jgi:hypothetical protein